MNTNQRLLSVVAICVGAGLVVVSCFWPSMVGGRQQWTDEQAKSYSDTLLAMHRLNALADATKEAAKRAQPGNPQSQMADKLLANSAETGMPIDPATATADRAAAELAAVQKRYAKERTELESAQSHGKGAATVMFWAGIVIAIVGLGWLAAISSAGNESV